MPKEPLRITMSSEIIEAIYAIAGKTKPKEGERPTVNLSAWLETMVAQFIFQGLKPRLHKTLRNKCQTPKDICSLLVAIQKAEAKEKGYSMNKDQETGVIRAVFGPDENGSKTMYPIPPKKRKATDKFMWNELNLNNLDIAQLCALTQIQAINE